MRLLSCKPKNGLKSHAHSRWHRRLQTCQKQKILSVEREIVRLRFRPHETSFTNFSKKSFYIFIQIKIGNQFWKGSFYLWNTSKHEHFDLIREIINIMKNLNYYFVYFISMSYILTFYPFVIQEIKTLFTSSLPYIGESSSAKDILYKKNFFCTLPDNLYFQKLNMAWEQISCIFISLIVVLGNLRAKDWTSQIILFQLLFWDPKSGCRLTALRMSTENIWAMQKKS